MISAEVEIGVLGQAAREFEAAAELALRAVDRLVQVAEMAALKGDRTVVVALVGFEGDCEAARAAAVEFADRVTRHAGVCDGVARVWSRRELDAQQAASAGPVTVAWGAGVAVGSPLVAPESVVSRVWVRVWVRGELAAAPDAGRTGEAVL